ncbi:MAG: efflux RND transporter permease subunit [Treponema sp.]|nr:efflux RND transporter permease subunit [Treponema sp.]
MKIFAAWLGRKKASLCILSGICAVSLCVILYSDGQKKSGGGSYSVSIRHYGVDAREMERSAAIPLEDALSAIPGLRSVQSSSENSLARVFARFSRNSRGQYEAVREAVQRVYETLPSSAQRPEIQSSDNSRIPVWSAAVFNYASAKNDPASGIGTDTAPLLERIVKPRLESLEGAGEALISGVGLREIIIALDQEKAAAFGIDPSVIAAALGMNDALFSGGTLRYGGREIIVSVDGRYDQVSDNGDDRVTSNLAALGEALIPLGDGRTAALSEIADVYEQERQPDTLSRLNGKKAAVISLMGSSGADLRKLSRDIQKELASLSLPLEFTVLSDRGAEEAAAFRSVFIAALQGAFMVALISFLLNRGKSKRSPPGLNRAGAFCALAIPAICVVSAALLAMSGLPPDRFVLAGLAAGIGSAVDPVILCAEKLRKSRTYGEARSALAQVRGPLVAGAATTAAALLPLGVMDFKAGIIARAISAVTLTAMALSLSLLPPLLLWDLESPALNRKTFLPRFTPCLSRCYAPSLPFRIFFIKLFRRLSRKTCRFLAANSGLCVRRPALVLLAVMIISAGGVFALFIRGADSGTSGSENSLYAQVEFEGGLLAEETDRLLAEYGETLAGKEGITYVQTGAKTGSGNLLVSFDPKRLSADRAGELVRSITIPGAFVFLSENPAAGRYWEIKIFGDDGEKCRELAEELARSSAALPLVRERILNFKAGGKKLTLLPDRERLAETGISFYRVADMARRGVHGPVAYKRVGPQGEIDVRVRSGTRAPSRAETLELLVSAEGQEARNLPLDSLTRIRESVEPAGIRREDRRRMASVTLGTKAMDPRRVKKEMTPLFGKIELPPGYSIEFDPEAIRRAEALSGTCLSLLLALTFCYMVIASVNESFVTPLAVLSAVPPSLALPALCLALSGRPLDLAAACAFVAVSGMTVNAAVLCAGGMRRFPRSGDREQTLSLYRLLRRKMPALLATAGTTIAGALPFLLLREQANDMVRTLSLVCALGVAASCIFAISVVPAVSLILTRQKSAP